MPGGAKGSVQHNMLSLNDLRMATGRRRIFALSTIRDGLAT
jgi:hypothetical protein